MAVRFLRWLFGVLFSILTKRTVTGKENLPSEGPYIVATNHLAIFDVALVFVTLGEIEITGWAGEKWQQHPIFGPLLRLGGGIFIQRGEVDRGALGAAVQWLKEGKIFGMAPEGTRSKTGSMQRAKLGVAYLAHMSGALVVPLAITGTEKVGRAWRRLRRPLLTLRFGEPFHLPPIDEKDRSAGMRRAADEVMCRIAAMLPSEYRGVYADHPRLAELLSGSTA
jgi:1-acyl-sn-glycerol-3-phosphate acyltransferase